MSAAPPTDPTAAPDVEITLHDGPTAPDDVVAALTDLRLAARAERDGDDPPPPRRSLEIALRGPQPAGEVERWALATVDGESVGMGSWEIDTNDNPQLAWLNVYVRPAWRGRGIGRRIARALTADAAARGASEIGFGVVGHIDAGRSLIGHVETAWGLPCRLVERISRLRLEELDADDIRAQAAARTARVAERYRPLFFQDDDFPTAAEGFDLTDFFDMGTEIDNLMPLEDLSMAPEHWTLERWTGYVARGRAQGKVLWNYVAQRLADGRIVGLSNVSFDPADPWRVQQWATGVRKSEQNQGLGKALKLWMLVKLLDEVPGARVIDTGNAVSNAPMIGINTDLGFREHFRENCYQLGLDRWWDLLGGA